MIDKELYCTICEEYLTGLSRNQIGALHNIGSNTVFRILVRCGVPIREDTRERKRYKPPKNILISDNLELGEEEMRRYNEVRLLRRIFGVVNEEDLRICKVIDYLKKIDRAGQNRNKPC
jgi:hypothetical protein